MAPEIPSVTLSEDSIQQLDVLKTSLNEAKKALDESNLSAEKRKEIEGELNKIYNQSTESIKKYGTAATSAFETIKSDSINGFIGTMSSFGSFIDKGKEKLQELQNTMSKGGPTFGIVAAGILNIRKSMEGLSSGFDKDLSTFSEPFAALKETLLKNTPASDAYKEGMGALKAILEKTGIPANALSKIMSGTTETILGYASAVLKSADEGVYATNVLFGLSGKTGDLDKIYQSAGPHLENMNTLLAEQSNMWIKSADATGKPIDVMKQYYAELGKIPNILNDTVVAGGTTFNSLTAVTKLAAGAGRDTSEVIRDESSAVKNYGLNAKDALQYVGRMTELNSHLGGSFETIKSSLETLSNDFVMFGVDGKNNLEGAVEILNTYSEGLKKAGLSSDQAVMATTRMTSSIASLSIAQKSFLMSQSGGPGGLRGGFAFEDMINKGKTKEAMDMIMKQVQKSSGGGNFVTVEEAGKSEAAARQLERQTKTLQMFGIGKGSEAEAHKILAGFENVRSGKTTGKELSTDIIGKLTGRGTEIENITRTDASNMRNALDGISVMAHITNYDTLRTFGSSEGKSGETTVDFDRHKAEMRKVGIQAGIKSGEQAGMYKDQLNKGAVNKKETLKEQIEETVNRGTSISPGSLLSQAKYMVYGEEKPTEQSQRKMLNEDIKKRVDINPPNKEMEKAAKMSMATNPPKTSANMRNIYKPEDIKKDSDRKERETAINTSEHNHQPPGEINVKVTGYCIKCKKDIESDSQVSSITPDHRR